MVGLCDQLVVVLGADLEDGRILGVHGSESGRGEEEGDRGGGQCLVGHHGGREAAESGGEQSVGELVRSRWGVRVI